MKSLLGIIMLLSIGLFGAACNASPASAPDAQAQQEAAPMEHGMEHSADQEHMDSGMQHIHADPPEAYATLTNPFAGNEGAISSGKTIFETQCVACHGLQGKGDGAAAASLNPKPANLADKKMLGSLSDGYLFWRVSEGGAMAPFNSAMPAWKASMSEEQRWQVVTYLRTLGQ